MNEMNTDVQEFLISVVVGIVFAAAAFGFAFFSWRNLDQVEFATPAFPVLDCAMDYSKDGGKWTLVSGEEITTNCAEILESDQADEARPNNVTLIAAYASVEEQIETIIETTPIGGPPIFKIIQYFVAAAGSIVPFIFYSHEIKVDPIDKQWKRATSTQQRLGIIVIHLAVALVVGYLLWFGADIARLFIDRIVPHIITFDATTSLGITTVVVGLLAFFVTRFSIGIRPTSLSGLAIFILLAGLIFGMLVTNVEWGAGLDPAFSNMSSHADPYILTLAIKDQIGSRVIFRITFIALGILMIVFSFEMHVTLRGMMPDRNLDTARQGFFSTGRRVVRCIWKQIMVLLRLSSDDENCTWYPDLNPPVILRIGVLAGILMMMVGLFPSRNGVCLNEPPFPGALSSNVCFSTEFSHALHGIGATGGVIVLWLLMFIYPLVGHPRLKAGDSNRPNPYHQRLSEIGVLLAVVALSLMVPYFLSVFFSDLSSLLRVIITALILVGALLIIFAYLSVTNPDYRQPESKLGETIGLLGITIVVTLYSLYITSGTEEVRLVTVEYAILAAFSILMYTYSMFTREYLDDLREGRLTINPSSAGSAEA